MQELTVKQRFRLSGGQQNTGRNLDSKLLMKSEGEFWLMMEDLGDS